MTSEFTLRPTADFFREHNFFHLDPDNVIMFEQRMLPAVTFDGRAILERKDKVAMAPGMPTPETGRDRGLELGAWRPGPGAGTRCLEAVWLRRSDFPCLGFDFRLSHGTTTRLRG